MGATLDDSAREEPAKSSGRFFGLSKDTWVLIGQLAALLALAIVLVGLQSLL